MGKARGNPEADYTSLAVETVSYFYTRRQLTFAPLRYRNRGCFGGLFSEDKLQRWEIGDFRSANLGIIENKPYTSKPRTLRNNPICIELKTTRIDLDPPGITSKGFFGENPQVRD